jgi:hypothetical protein
MCSSYWNLKVEFVCPRCGLTSTDDIQTHFMGEPGSCVNYYGLGEPVAELQGIATATLGPDGPDDFIGICGHCVTCFDFGGRIEDGRVIEVWPFRETP